MSDQPVHTKIKSTSLEGNIGHMRVSEPDVIHSGEKKSDEETPTPPADVE
jgi:hypothetical protein